MKNMGHLLKQAQKMQDAIRQVQEGLAGKKVSSSAGGGMVEVVANCRQTIMEIKINPEVVDPNDTELLQDLLLAAVNEALGRAGDLAAEEMKKVTGGLNLPGIF